MPLCHVFQAAIKPPTAMKSGTTICGIQLKDAVLLAADTRATEGPMVADKKLYLKFSTVLFPPTMVQRCRVSISFLGANSACQELREVALHLQECLLRRGWHGCGLAAPCPPLKSAGGLIGS